MTLFINIDSIYQLKKQRIEKMENKILGLVVLSSHLAFAQTTMLETIQVNEIADNSLEALSSQHTIKERGQSNNIGDFIADDTEISLNKKTGFGDNGKNLQLRGQSGNRIALNVDGNNVNSIGGLGAVYIDFSSIPMDNIERVEILKGGSSVEYGHVLGGVINAYTKKPQKKASFSFYGTSGGWDSANNYSNIRTSFSKRFGDFGISLGGSKQEADGYLWNNDYESKSISSSLYYFTPNGGELSLGVVYSDTTRGVIKDNSLNTNSDYPISFGENLGGGCLCNQALALVGEGAEVRKKRTLLNASYSQAIGEDILFKINAYKNKEDRTDKNFAATSGTTYNKGDLIFNRELEADDTYGIKAKTTVFFDKHEVLFGAEYKDLVSDIYTITDLNEEYNKAKGGPSLSRFVGTTTEPSKAKQYGIFLSDRIQYNDNLSFQIGARYDNFEVENRYGFKADDAKLTPKLGMEYITQNNNIFGLYAYQTFRSPGSPELMQFTNSYNSGKPEFKDITLKSESANALDFVYKHNFSPSNFLKTSFFYYDVKDYFTNKSIPGELFQGYNLDKATFLGLTLNGQYKLNDKSIVKGAITYQRTRKEGDVLDPNNISERIDYVPNVKANLSFYYDITQNLKSTFALNYTGTRYYERNSTSVEKLESFTLADLSFSYKVLKNSALEIYGENIFDKEYNSTYGVPAIGRTVGISYKYSF